MFGRFCENWRMTDTVFNYIHNFIHNYSMKFSKNKLNITTLELYFRSDTLITHTISVQTLRI